MQHVGQILSLAFWPIALFLPVAGARARLACSQGFLAGLVAGVMALGRDQVAYLALWLLIGVVAASWLQAQEPLSAARRSFLPLAAGAFCGALVIAVPIGLTLFLAESSSRPDIPYGEAARGSIHPSLLLTSVIPNLFGADGPFNDYWGAPSPRWGESDLVLARNMGVLYLGALPFAILVAGALKGVLWAREVRYFTIAFVAMLLYALGGATPFFRLAFEALPGIEFFRRPADAAFFVGAMGSILAGYLVHRVFAGTFLRHGSPWGLGEILIGLAAFAVAIAMAFEKDMLQLAARTLVKSAFCLAGALALLSILPSMAQRRPILATMLLVLFFVGDLAWNNGPSESTGLAPETYDVLRPQSRNETIATLKSRLGADGLDRIELIGLGFHWPNASLVHRLHNVLGYNPVRLGLYTRATGAEDHAALPDQRRFSALFPSYRSRLADLLGLRFIASGVPVEEIDHRLAPGDLSLIARTPDGFIYENPRALPRIRFASKAVEADFERLLRDGKWPDFDPATTVLLAEAPAEPTDGPAASASIRLASYRNTEVVIDVDATTPGYVVLNDPYHAWWDAEVDGQEAPLLQADVIFRAVKVPAGAHRLRFVFRPFKGAWRDARRRWPWLDW